MLRNIFVLTVLISSSPCFGLEVCRDVITNSSKAMTALILARGGSKGIKLKNIQRIDGVSLLGISLTALQQAKLFDSIWVSTDHDEIAEEAARYEVNVHWRDPQTALDTTTSIVSVQEFLKNHPKVVNLALVQCTSPFINRGYLQKAFREFSKHHCVFSVLRSHKLRWMSDGESGRIVPVNFDYRRRPRRQDWDGELIEAGMLYFAHRSLLDDGLFQDDRCGIVEIQPEDSMEIDTPNDLATARLLSKLRTGK